MTIQEQIKKDLTGAMKAKDEKKKNALRVVMGEFGRTDKKEVSDEDAVRVLRKLIKSEQEVLEKKGETESRYIQILEGYLPDMASEEEIRAWIDANIDFSEYKNKMQAMRPIMAHFGSRADGNLVKTVLQGV